jgi:hypothetical protein
MGLLERIREWAASGAKTDPGDSYIENGWAYRVRPPRQYWNYVENERDKAINRLVDADAAQGTAPGGAGLGDVCSGLYGHQWALPGHAPNILDAAGNIWSSCVGKNISDPSKPSLYILLSDEEIYPVTGCWDYSDSPAMGSALALSYPATPTEVCSVASDGDYLFVLWGLTSSNFKVSCFSLLNFSGAEVWTVDTGVTYTSPPLWKYSDLIVASDTYLAALVSSSTAYEFVRIPRSGAAASHAEEAGGLTITPRCVKLVSDGTYLYCMGSTVSGSDWISKMIRVTIANLSTQNVIFVGGVVSTTYNIGHFTGLISTSDNMVAVSEEGKVYLVNKSLGGTDAFYCFDLTGFSPPASDTDFGVFLGSDGINIWGMWLDLWDYAPTYNFFSIPIAELVYYAEDSPTPREIKPAKIVVESYELDTTVRMGTALFDGRDMWFVLETGKMYRICNPGMRR